ncbi:TPA: hypothetical protein ACKPYC_002074 [Pseudomonas aeruginosa]|uniref:hypothetical protein n=1 Tax=Pseudomonas TaxID=286 RepID=UPI00053EBDB4|nr:MULTISPECIES: hypothetical protein [Pseudomonas]AYW43006.1 hypothetical protein DL351_27685 [Pseudomonas aeruginosa]KSC10259.1 hypothetical protein AO886_29615 [Pseudomonas aeruginosa]KSG17142.1 hypothetical protein AO946_31655 [Pseudomonas aeruginosa]MBA5620387.1 hypothetical protein [Pseudomonas aeruginosa]MBG5429754.1 hypothetical protein [Pseudomonas aeruginosa]
MIRYYCIQARDKTAFPYGKAGPIRTLTEARRALRMLRHDFPGQTLEIYECVWFLGVGELEWDERFAPKRGKRKAPAPRRASRAVVQTPALFPGLTSTAQEA